VRTWTVHGIVRRLIDADSVVIDLDLGWDVWIMNRSVRVAHMNAPEIATAEGKAAKVIAAQLLPPASSVVVESHKLDKFGRVLASVQLADGRDFATEMIAAGQAVPYEGGAR
jgi:endonuclease YncB( thermonuclease family)